MQVRGNAGDDTIIVRSGGFIRIDYRGAAEGIRVDLGAGTVSDDGFGGSDTIRGRVREIHGSGFKDVIRGSDNDDSFIGGGGDDEIDGGGGFDRLRFDRRGVGDLIVLMEQGTATGTWNGRAFSYTFAGIEYVRGGPGTDIIGDSVNDDTLQGGRNADLFLLSGGGDDTIIDFDLDESDAYADDVLWIGGLEDFGLTRSDVIALARQNADGTLIDLSNYDRGTIFLQGVNKEELDNIALLLGG